MSIWCDFLVIEGDLVNSYDGIMGFTLGTMGILMEILGNGILEWFTRIYDDLMGF